MDVDEKEGEGEGVSQSALLLYDPLISFDEDDEWSWDGADEDNIEEENHMSSKEEEVVSLRVCMKSPFSNSSKKEKINDYPGYDLPSTALKAPSPTSSFPPGSPSRNNVAP